MAKLRCSVGVRPETYIGTGNKVYPLHSAEVDFAKMDKNTTLCYLLAHDSTLKEDQRVYLQLAVLYTTKSRQRRVRVHNLVVNASCDHKTIFKFADVDAVCSCLTKMAMLKALQKPLQDPGDGPLVWLEHTVVEILAKYRIYCSSQVTHD